MYLANAYPNSAISAGAMTLVALVMVGCLALWLIMVYRADSGGARGTRQATSHLDVTLPAPTAQDEHNSDASPVPADQRHGAAA